MEKTIKRKKKRDQSTWQLWVLAIVPAALVFLFSYVPMFGIIIAFKDYKMGLGIFKSAWNGFDNFKYLLGSDTFFRITRNTLVMNIIFIFVGLVAAVSLAIVLYRLTSRRFTKVYQTILITPNFLSWVVVSYMAYAILHPQSGVLNQILVSFGAKPVNWYNTPGAWPWILTVANTWKHVGMNSVIYYAALMGIDASLFEAAEVDGATQRQVTRYILVPCITSIMIMLTILNIGSIFRADFGLFYQIPRNVGALYETTDVIDTYIFRSVQGQTSNLGVTSAIGLMQSVVGFVMVVTTNFIVGKIDPDSQLF